MKPDALGIAKRADDEAAKRGLSDAWRDAIWWLVYGAAANESPEELRNLVFLLSEELRNLVFLLSYEVKPDNVAKQALPILESAAEAIEEAMGANVNEV